MNALIEGDELILSGGQVSINQPIIVKTKNVQLTAHEKFTIKAVSAMDACLKLEAVNSSSIQYGVEFDNITIDGNNLANHCLLFEDGIGLYTTEIKVRRVKCSKALLDGIKIVAPSWVMRLNNCNSEYNGRDGIRITTKGNLQVNAVHVIDSVTRGNTGNGISLNGISHVLKGNTIERNYYGVSIDPTIDSNNGVLNAVYNLVIKDNYFELNRKGEIYAKSTRSGQISGLSINNNYFWSNVVGGSGTLIKCEGSLNFIKSLNLEDNTYLIDGVNVTKIFDGGNALGADSNIGVIVDPNKFVNIGLARATWHDYKVLPVPPKLVQNSNYDLTQKSENIMWLIPKKIVFGLPNEISSKLVRSLNVYTETDSTNYTIRWKFIVKSLTTGAIVKQVSGDIPKTQSSLITGNVLNTSLAYERLSNTEFAYCEFELLNNTDGTFLYFHVPYVEMSH
ncbi:hypothetical protein [Peribacillus sp. TH24]|uniref:hypothetical protein n=1 Tax=Peribacillus sp. TH24 TaxID=2798483 RepID=UPI001A935BBE|nr:hypothetical protein [Peribacillus sp. TH24]